MSIYKTEKENYYEQVAYMRKERNSYIKVSIHKFIVEKMGQMKEELERLLISTMVPIDSFLC